MCVVPSDIPLFAEYSNSFGKTPCSSLILDYLEARGKQPKLRFDDFTALADTLMLESNVRVIE